MVNIHWALIIMMVYLAVPFAEKEEAKLLGAKWDYKKKLWFAPNGEDILIEKWPLNPTPITILQGEDRNFGGNLLFVDLIPNSCWFTNLRSSVHPKDWDRLRRFIYERAGNKCECCQSNGNLEAHERWSYDNKKRVQKLMRLIALCRSCHESTHMGLAEVKNRDIIAKKHLELVRGMTEEEVNHHVSEAFAKWEERNKYTWDLDISIVLNAGIEIKKHYTQSERKDLANGNANAMIKPISRDSIEHYFNEFL